MAPLGLDLASKRKRTRSDYGFWLDYRLRWNDNDMFAHMNNPVYGVLVDSIANTYLMQHCGYKASKSDQAAIIANTHCDYFGSMSYPHDTVECGLRVVKLGKASVQWEVGFFLKDDKSGSCKAVGGSTHVFVAQDTATGALGRVRPEGMPAEARAGLEKLLNRQGGEGVETKESKEKSKL